MFPCPPSVVPCTLMSFRTQSSLPPSPSHPQNYDYYLFVDSCWLTAKPEREGGRKFKIDNYLNGHALALLSHSLSLSVPIKVFQCQSLQTLDYRQFQLPSSPSGRVCLIVLQSSLAVVVTREVLCPSLASRFLLPQCWFVHNSASVSV